MIEQEIRNLVDAKTTWSVQLNHIIENTSPPYVVVRKLSAPRGHTLDSADGTVVSTFQIDLFSSDYKTAKEEAYKIYDLQNETSTMIAFIAFVNEVDMYEYDTKLHHIVLQFDVFNYE